MGGILFISIFLKKRIHIDYNSSKDCRVTFFSWWPPRTEENTVDNAIDPGMLRMREHKRWIAHQGQCSQTWCYSETFCHERALCIMMASTTSAHSHNDRWELFSAIFAFLWFIFDLVAWPTIIVKFDGWQKWSTPPTCWTYCNVRAVGAYAT